MEKVCQICKESASLLNDVLENPNPVEYDVKGGSVDRLGILEAVMIQGYQHALTLKNLGRVQEGLADIDRALDRFTDALAILRKGQYKELSAEQWEVIKKLHYAQLSDQYQLRAILLASVGRDQEACGVNAWIMSMVRQFAESHSSTDNDSKLSLALLFSGDLARQRGQIDEAITAYEESMTITRRLYAEYPKLKVFRSRHNVSLMRLAGLLRFRDLPRARQLYTEARQIAQEMVQADTNAIGSYFSLALVSPFSGPPERAVELAEEILDDGTRAGLTSIAICHLR
jgi:tetratricopeptide (TPR) repeat protein